MNKLLSRIDNQILQDFLEDLAAGVLNVKRVVGPVLPAGDPVLRRQGYDGAGEAEVWEFELEDAADLGSEERRLGRVYAYEADIGWKLTFIDEQGIFRLPRYRAPVADGPAETHRKDSGFAYVDLDAERVNVVLDAADHEIVTCDLAQTLTEKTIDGEDNTIQFRRGVDEEPEYDGEPALETTDAGPAGTIQLRAYYDGRIYGVTLTDLSSIEPDDLDELAVWWDFSEVAHVNIGSSNKVLGAYDLSGGTNYLGSSGGYEPLWIAYGALYLAQFEEAHSDRMWCPDAAELNFGSGDFSIFVVYKSADANWGALVTKGNAHRYYTRLNEADSNDGYLHFSIDDDTTSVVLSDGGENYRDDNLRVVCFRRDGDNLRSYSNGDETGASPVDITGYGSLDDAGTTLYVGCHLGSTMFFDGDIGEIALFKGSLSNEEVAQLFNYFMTKWGIS